MCILLIFNYRVKCATRLCKQALLLRMSALVYYIMKNILFDPQAVTSAFIQSFAEENVDILKSILAKDMKSYITNAEGGVNLLKGNDALIHSFQSLDVKTVKPDIQITQMVTIKVNQVMVMVEIKAKRKNKSLHNFATFLLDFDDGLINELHMVEALPAYSDEFWKN